MQIAIDGPSAAGKSTIAKMLAKKMGYVYLDTGAMYRAAGWLALQKGIDLTDEIALEQLMQSLELDVKLIDLEQYVIINGTDVTSLIRSAQCGMAASKISANRCVREKLVFLQQQLAEGKDVVMDGRDIAAKVLPQAQHKFFLTASPEVRAKRRLIELQQKGETLSFEEVLAQINERDLADTTRKESHLTFVPEATEVSTDDLSIEEVVQVMLVLMNRYDLL